MLSREHPGVRSDQVPEAAILFPAFKPERTRAVLASIDEELLGKGSGRVVWIVGKPHLESDYWRAKAMRDINGIHAKSRSYDISTFDYRDCLQCLERIHESWHDKYNLTISPLGSKLQSVGAALFWHMHQEISFVFSVPQKYNAKLYSEGFKATWMIEFDNVAKLRELLDSVGQLQIVD